MNSTITIDALAADALAAAPATNGNAPKSRIEPTAAPTAVNWGGLVPLPTSQDILDYSPQDGGILDFWRVHESAAWLYVDGYKAWFQWCGTHWQEDESQRLQGRLQALVEWLHESAKLSAGEVKVQIKQLTPRGAVLNEEQEEQLQALQGRAAVLKAWIAATVRSASRMASVEKLAQPHRSTAAKSLDKGNVLNLANGTYDLDSMTLRPHDRADNLTYVLPYKYDAGATCPRWGRFLAETLGERDAEGNWQTDAELVRLVQMAVGYTLTEDTRYEKMFWLSGEGSNGKTTFLTTLHALLGELGTTVDFQMMGMPGNYEAVKLHGKRLALSTEATKGGGLSETLIKRVVSGEKIGARQIYAKGIEFESQAKVWWAMNDKPVIKDTSNAMWRRLVLIPFNRSFTAEEQDTGLLGALQGELPGVLNWALEGLAKLRAAGQFPTVATVQDAVTEYRHEANPIAQWLAERATPSDAKGLRIGHDGALLWTPAHVCFLNYSQWAAANGRQTMNNTTFGRELGRLVKKMQTNAGARYQLGLLVTD